MKTVQYVVYRTCTPYRTRVIISSVLTIPPASQYPVCSRITSIRTRTVLVHTLVLVLQYRYEYSSQYTAQYTEYYL